MHAKFQANTIRFDQTNMTIFSAHSDFQSWTEFNT